LPGAVIGLRDVAATQGVAVRGGNGREPSATCSSRSAPANGPAIQSPINSLNVEVSERKWVTGHPRVVVYVPTALHHATSRMRVCWLERECDGDDELRQEVERLLGARERLHFFSVAAQQLRRVLVDHARRVRSEKRGGGNIAATLLDFDGAACPFDDRLLAVDEALSKLEALDPRAAKVIELRFFGGLTEAAETLDISLATLKRDWDFARNWLATQLV
jgi:DNA-directed RNA polymerase specialized sigma24 family protein